MFLLKEGYTNIPTFTSSSPFLTPSILPLPRYSLHSQIDSLSFFDCCYIYMSMHYNTHKTHPHTYIYTTECNLLSFLYIISGMTIWHWAAKNSASFMGNAISPFPSCSQLPIILCPVVGPMKPFHFHFNGWLLLLLFWSCLYINE